MSKREYIMKQARAIRADMDKVAANLPDEEALDAMNLYPLWAVGVNYLVDDRRRYGDSLYRCIQAHTSQTNWTPPQVPALWVKISLDEWPAWEKPTGAHDAYKAGDKVTHNGSRWVSNVDNNVWEPCVYGWTREA